MICNEERGTAAVVPVSHVTFLADLDVHLLVEAGGWVWAEWMMDPINPHLQKWIMDTEVE